jgi:membrane protein YdbS with pleckstrin-like domain
MCGRNQRICLTFDLTHSLIHTMKLPNFFFLVMGFLIGNMFVNHRPDIGIALSLVTLVALVSCTLGLIYYHGKYRHWFFAD